MKRYAVIPTGNRPEEYGNLVAYLESNDVSVLTVATTPEALNYAVGEIIRCDVKNIQMWWNLGIERAYELGASIVAILNDDAILPDGWFEDMESAVVGHSGASGMRFGNQQKISGYAFVLNPADLIKADERFIWWYGDDDIQRQCEEKNGFAFVPNLEVGNVFANSSYSSMKYEIMADRKSFHRKWGHLA